MNQDRGIVVITKAFDEPIQIVFQTAEGVSNVLVKVCRIEGSGSIRYFIDAPKEIKINRLDSLKKSRINKRQDDQRSDELKKSRQAKQNGQESRKK